MSLRIALRRTASYILEAQGAIRTYGSWSRDSSSHHPPCPRRRRRNLHPVRAALCGSARGSSRVREGRDLRKACQGLDRMVKQGIPVSTDVFLRLLQRCIDQKDLATGRHVHVLLVETELRSSSFLAYHLIRLYSSFGELEEANQVFRNLPAPDVFVWTAIIAAQDLHGEAGCALELYLQMQELRVAPNAYVFVAVLKACTHSGCLAAGRIIHAHILQRGFDANMFVATALVGMYAECGRLVDGRTFFDAMPVKDVVTWTVMIDAYAQHGACQEALYLFQQMQMEGLEPDSVTLVSIVKACSSTAALDQGKVLHAFAMRSGWELDLLVGSALVDMYAKCGSVTDARSVFDALPTRNLITWNTLIAAYAQQGAGTEALQVFWHMQECGMQPDHVTISCVLSACSSIAALDQGKLIHARIAGTDLRLNAIVGNALIDLYAKCGCLEEALGVFNCWETKDLVSWNAIISGYVQEGDGESAIKLFELMQHTGVLPNLVTVVSILAACSSLLALDWGLLVHAITLDVRCESDPKITNALIDMYAKCGRLEAAETLFSSLCTRDLVCWNSLLAGYAQHGAGQAAVKLFHQMLVEGVQPDQVTVVSILQACSSVAALNEGRRVHKLIPQLGLQSNVFVCNTLIDMYAKCGRLEESLKVLDSMQKKDLVSWNSAIVACAQHGRGDTALELFQQMQLDGMFPDSVTFVGLLTASSHMGLLQQGSSLFQSMYECFKIIPEMKHCVCMVDLLCRSGHLLEAAKFINEMHLEPSVAVWMSLLSACRNHSNLPLARQSFEAVLSLDATDSAAYTLMGAVYAEAGSLPDKLLVRRRMVAAGAKKEPGRTWIEIDCCVNTFAVNDDKHPDRKQIFRMLEKLRSAEQAQLL